MSFTNPATQAYMQMLLQQLLGRQVGNQAQRIPGTLAEAGQWATTPMGTPPTAPGGGFDPSNIPLQPAPPAAPTAAPPAAPPAAAPIPGVDPLAAATAQEKQGMGGVNAPGAPATAPSAAPPTTTTGGMQQLPGGGVNPWQQLEWLENPREALLASVGLNADPRNSLMKRILGDFSNSMPLLSALSAMMGGGDPLANPEGFDVLGFSRGLMQGATGNGQMFDILGAINSILGRAAAGDEVALSNLEGFGPEQIAAAQALGMRTRGVHPALIAGQQARTNRALQQQRIGFIQAGDETADETASWARLLAGLTARR